MSKERSDYVIKTSIKVLSSLISTEGRVTPSMVNESITTAELMWLELKERGYFKEEN